MLYHHVFSGPPGQTPELVARDVQSPQGVRDAIRAQLGTGPSAIRVVTTEVKFQPAWDQFCAENRDDAQNAGDGSAEKDAASPSDVLGTWAEVTDEFIKD